MPRRLIPLLTLILALLLPAAAAAAPPPVIVTQKGTRALTVSLDKGSATSQPSGMTCPGTCRVTKEITRICVDGECPDWPVATEWTLTAANGPAGYTAKWSDCALGATCTVAVGDEAFGDAAHTATLTWVDTQNPTVTFAQPGKRGPANYVVTAAGADNSGSVASYRWTVGGVVQAATGSTLSLAGASHGTHAVSVVAIDGVGRSSTAVTRQVVVDKQAGVTATALPAVTRADILPVAFTADNDVVARECSFDGGTWTNCASGWSGISAATPDGQHTYKVRVTDDVGNVGESALLSTIVDRTLPTVAFTDGPAEGQQVVTRTAAITFSVAEARLASVRCRLDAGAWAPCTPGTAVRMSGLADGAHAFTVEASDTAGNVRTVTRSFAVKVPVDVPPPPPPPVIVDPPAPPPPPPVVIPTFAPRFVYDSATLGRKTRFLKLSLADLPKSATVKVACKGPGCKGKSRTLRHAGGRLNVLKALRGLRLRAGAKLTITVSDGAERKVATFTIRNRKAIAAVYRCMKGGRLGSC